MHSRVSQAIGYGSCYQARLLETFFENSDIFMSFLLREKAEHNLEEAIDELEKKIQKQVDFMKGLTDPEKAQLPYIYSFRDNINEKILAELGVYAHTVAK